MPFPCPPFLQSGLPRPHNVFYPWERTLVIMKWYTKYTIKVKKALRETQTLRAGRSKAEPKIFIPPQTPFPGAQDCQNLISWRWSLPAPTDPVWWRLMHTISSYRGNRHRHKHTNRTDYNTLRRYLACSVIKGNSKIQRHNKPAGHHLILCIKLL